ncbi:PilW family protein [Vitreoscilla massiliensis]|uniref:PilW family protein n=1 Tax=Vitreoscilla massiliensis TaxID=1689272 RepID=UPI00071DADE9|nr:hypothetical protein [Vitreoscilla massiliensis]
MIKKTSLSRLGAYSHVTRQTGFTLIEFIVAAILGLIVLLAIGGAYVATQRVNETATARVNRQQELRLAGNMLIRDARNAGTFGCANLVNIASTGLSEDHQSTKLSFNNDASYFDLNPVSVAERVYSSRILNAADAGGIFGNVIQNINSTFVPQNDSQMIIFNYGVNTQSLSTSTLVGTNSLSKFTVENASNFSHSTVADARVVLASCGRVDILHRNQLSVSGQEVTIANSGAATSQINIPFYKTGVIFKEIAGGAITDPLKVQYGVQATISNLQTVVYAVGNIPGDTQATSLYRFELLNDGSWSAPQLMARNISKMEANYVYVTKCAASTNNAGTEMYVTGTDSFKEDGGAVYPPTGVRLTLTPSAFQIDAVDATADTATNATDLEPIVMDATMRGGNTCANR